MINRVGVAMSGNQSKQITSARTRCPRWLTGEMVNSLRLGFFLLVTQSSLHMFKQ